MKIIIDDAKEESYYKLDNENENENTNNSREDPDINFMINIKYW